MTHDVNGAQRKNAGYRQPVCLGEGRRTVAWEVQRPGGTQGRFCTRRIQRVKTAGEIDTDSERQLLSRLQLA